MANTENNLKEAFAGESQANRRYLFSAEKAEQEGLPQIAKLFRAVAEAETVHARNHLKTLGQINTTAENLTAAIAGEDYEFKTMYPGFIEQAQKDGNKNAERSFNFANKVEKIHHGLYQQALETVKSGADLKAAPVYVCQVCGYTVSGSAPDKCPVCGAPLKQFKEVN